MVVTKADDAFVELARYYDPIMDHIDYDRWVLVTSELATLSTSAPLTHLDVACGTCVLLKRLAKCGWRSVGVDLSFPMLRAGQRGLRKYRRPVVAGDMRALPLGCHFDVVTCLFDSVNFLLEQRHLDEGLEELARILLPGGILYFDIITERMVTEHYENQKWTERYRRFTTTWHSTYDRNTGVADTTIKISSGFSAVIRERVYTLDEVMGATKRAGLRVLGVRDAETWKAPTKKSLRLDIVATRRTGGVPQKKFDRVVPHIREFFA